MTWVGAENGVWNDTTLNFKDNDGNVVAFSTNDDVLFDDSVAESKSIVLGKNVTVGNLVFDISDRLTLGNTSAVQITPASVAKRGDGELWVNPTGGNFVKTAGPVRIFAGKVVLDGTAQASQFGCENNPATTYEIFPGAELRVQMRNGLSGNSTNGRYGGNVIVRTNGVFALQKRVGDANGVWNRVRSLTLDGGEFVPAANGYETMGLLAITERLAFSGPNPYVLSARPNVRNTTGAPWKDQYLCLGTNTAVEIDVADITGRGVWPADDLPDVTFAADYPLTKCKDWRLPTHLRKTGAGKLVFAASQSLLGSNRAIDGDIAVEEGTLTLTNVCAVMGSFERKISVSEGATLEISSHNPFHAESGFGQVPTAPIKTGIEVHGGSLVLARGYENNNGGQVQFGPLTLDNANFDYRRYFYGTGGRGAIAFTGKTSFLGDTPYYLGQTNTLGNAARQSICLWDGTTEFFVADITQDDGVDVWIEHNLINRKAANNVEVPCGFTKSGPGTLRLGAAVPTAANLGKDSTYSGDVIIKEGVLQLGPDAGIQYGGSYLLGLWTESMAERRIIIEKDGVLYVPNRNMFFGAVSAANNKIANVKLVVRGTLKVRAGQCNVWPCLVMDGGTLDFGVGGMGGFGAVIIGRELAFAGDAPRELALPKGQAATKSTMIGLNAFAETFVSVPDLTGSAAVDATISRPLGRIKTAVDNKSEIGFTKTGAGTLRLASDAIAEKDNRLNGLVTIREGAVLVDGQDLCDARQVEVLDGAGIGGSGGVKNVRLADGSRLMLMTGGTDNLHVSGNLELGQNLTIDIANLAGKSAWEIRSKLLTVEGTISGAENLASCTVVMDGEDVTSKMHVSFVGNTLRCNSRNGTLILVR